MSILALQVANELIHNGRILNDYSSYGINTHWYIPANQANIDKENTVQMATTTWYNEIKQYDFSKEPTNVIPTSKLSHL